MKVVMLGPRLGEDFSNDLRKSFPSVTFIHAPTTEDQKREIADADVCFGSPSREVFLTAKRLRWIHEPGTGIDRLLSTVPELVASDVVLTNARGPHANPMADHVIAMMLTFAHNLRELWEDQQAHRWDGSRYSARMIELSGQTMGILALGGIGLAVARRAHGFGMKVYAVDVRPPAKPPEVEAIWGIDRLDELLQISDWFVVTAPRTPQTLGLLDRRRLGLLKPGSHLIVISRGGIVDEPALIEALRSRHIAGAGLDVTAEEPLPPRQPSMEP